MCYSVESLGLFCFYTCRLDSNFVRPMFSLGFFSKSSIWLKMLPSVSWGYHGSRGWEVHAWQGWGGDAGSSPWGRAHDGPWLQEAREASCGKAKIIIKVLVNVIKICDFSYKTYIDGGCMIDILKAIIVTEFLNVFQKGGGFVLSYVLW